MRVACFYIVLNRIGTNCILFRDICGVVCTVYCLKSIVRVPKTHQVYNYIEVPHLSLALDYQAQVYRVVRVCGKELFKILHTLCGKSSKE